MKSKSILSTLTLIASAASLLAADIANAQIRSGRTRADFEHHVNQGRHHELVLHMRGEIYGNRGGRENGTLYIKKEIRNQHPHLQLQNYKLESVTVIGVSEARRSPNSLLTLYVGDRYQDQAILDHRGHGPRGMDQARLHNQRRQGDVNHPTWQIDFSARTQVRRVIVQLKTQKRGGHHGIRFQSKGEYKAMKAVALPEVISINEWADTLQIRGVSKVVTIQSVVAIFQNGSRQTLDLRGVVGPGQRLRDSLQRERKITHLIVTSMSNDLIGSRGKYEVLVGSSGRR